jgi:hypothetical protein
MLLLLNCFTETVQVTESRRYFRQGPRELASPAVYAGKYVACEDVKWIAVARGTLTLVISADEAL